MKKTFLFILLILPLLCFGQIEDPSKISTSQKFDEILTYINRLYVDSVDKEELTDAAIVAMLEQLDPHSSYISKEEVAEANSSINGSFVGIGVRYQMLKDTFIVVATIPGGPSEKLGIKAGDKIIKVDGVTVAGVGMSSGDVRSKLMGELGTKVRLEINRKNASKNIDFIITRDNIPIFSVDASYMINNEIGYIKLNSFSRTTSEEVQKALKELKAQGMQHLIFDLQDNGGGLLDASQRLADEFLSDGKLVVYSEGRSQPRTDLNSYKKGLWEKGSLILLTDEYTASASEILSGAIQDWDRGLIVGRRTYGKGLVQRPIDLTDGSQIRLTIARYFTPSGRFIQKPYDDLEAYRNDLTLRYDNGEFVNQDSIKIADSLLYYTLVKKRTVYGGGGIMPDIFVPLDTTKINDLFGELNQRGLINSFSLVYVEKNRISLFSTYPSFSDYKKYYNPEDALINEFKDYVKVEDEELTVNESDLEEIKTYLKNRFKALIAQNIWGYNEFYQIYNDENEVLQKAIEIIVSGEYEKQNLVHEKDK
jgi:carboxyl-terminal processing protease